MDAPSRLSRCPECHQIGSRYLDIPETADNKHYAIHRCRSCEMRYTVPFPTQEDLDHIYSGAYWPRETQTQKGAAVGRSVERFNQLRLARMIRPLLIKIDPGASILEVGCGSGQLAAYLKQRGFDVEVTDVSRDILGEVRALYGIHGYCGNMEQIAFRRTYDAIIFNNVLEHVPAPSRTIARAADLMNNGGIIFIEVPNIDSLQFAMFKSRWYHLAIPQHLYHFSPETISGIMKRFSLNLIWRSTYSQRISAAGYAASLSPALRPEKLRQSWSKAGIFIYLMLQVAALPLVGLESWWGRGGALRAMYQKSDATRDAQAIRPLSQADPHFR